MIEFFLCQFVQEFENNYTKYGEGGIILAEYDEVLHRSKFYFKEKTIQLVINAVKQYGMEVFLQPTGEILLDILKNENIIKNKNK